MKKRSDEIAQENASLYDQMRQSVIHKELPATDDSDTDDSGEIVGKLQPIKGEVYFEQKLNVRMK